MRDIESALRRELKDPEYSEGYAESFLNSFLATQVRVLRQQRRMTERELADATCLSVSSIRRMEDVNNPSWSIPSLIRLARAFRVRLKVSFETYGSLPVQAVRLTRTQLERVPREADPGLWAQVGQDQTVPRSSIYEALRTTGQVNAHSALTETEASSQAPLEADTDRAANENELTQGTVQLVHNLTAKPAGSKLWEAYAGHSNYVG